MKYGIWNDKFKTPWIQEASESRIVIVIKGHQQSILAFIMIAPYQLAFGFGVLLLLIWMFKQTGFWFGEAIVVAAFLPSIVRRWRRFQSAFDPLNSDQMFGSRFWGFVHLIPGQILGVLGFAAFWAWTPQPSVLETNVRLTLIGSTFLYLFASAIYYEFKRYILLGSRDHWAIERAQEKDEVVRAFLFLVWLMANITGIFFSDTGVRFSALGIALIAALIVNRIERPADDAQDEFHWG